MKIIIDIPNDFTGDYIVDKFKDFFSRVATDIDCKGLCGNYEKEIAEMFIKAFEESEDEYNNNINNNIYNKALDDLRNELKDHYTEYAVDCCLGDTDYYSYTTACNYLEEFIDEVTEQLKKKKEENNND
jgi:hypothetical protein